MSDTTVKRWLINRVRGDDGLVGIYTDEMPATQEEFVTVDIPFVLASDYDAILKERDELLAGKQMQDALMMQSAQQYEQMKAQRDEAVAALEVAMTRPSRERDQPVSQTAFESPPSTTAK